MNKILIWLSEICIAYFLAMSKPRVSIIVLAMIISLINHLNSERVKEKQEINQSNKLTRQHDNGQEAEAVGKDNSGDNGNNKIRQKGTLNLTASRRKRYIELELWPELQQKRILLNGERHDLNQEGSPIISDVFKDIWVKKIKKPKLAKTPKQPKQVSQVEAPDNPIDLDGLNNSQIIKKRFLWSAIQNIFKHNKKKVNKPPKITKKPTKKPSESQTPEKPNLIVEINIYPEFHFNIDGNSAGNNNEIIISAIEKILSHSACGRLLNTIGGKKLISN